MPTPGTRYHINPSTGNANICRADKLDCRFKQGDNRHFDTKDSAQAFFEHMAEAESIDPVKTLKEIDKMIPDDDGTGSDLTVERYVFGKIAESLYAQDDRHKENILALKKMAALAKKKKLTDEDFDKLKDMYYRMSTNTNFMDFSSEKEFKKNVNALGAYLYARAKASRTKIEPVPGREQQDHIIGLFDAQNEFVNIINGGTDRYYRERGEAYIAVGAVSYGQETIDRYLAGQRVEADLDDVRHAENFNQNIYPVRDRLLAMVDRDNDAFSQQAYFGLVFPEKELKESFDKYGVDNVTVSPLDNGRETGLAYTVLDPDGNTRTFSVYEHRNRDSMIINGKTNMKNGELPYAADSKYEFFAEVPGDENAPKQVAERVAFFCQQAQRGELPDDATLAHTAEKMDWNSILAKQLPVFKEWAQDRGIEIHDVDDKSDEAVLRNLDFGTPEEH